VTARVGQSGRVVGLERESRILDAARQAAANHSLPVEFVQGDATSLELRSDSFDFVHERTVLLNVHDPATVIWTRRARLPAWLRCGRPGAPSRSPVDTGEP